MHSTEQSGGRRGSAVLLALLVSLLLGSGSAAASPQTRSAAASQLTGGKATAVAPSVKREADDGADRADPLSGSGRGAVVETHALDLRPVAVGFASAVFLLAAPRPSGYRARAPPAA